MLLLIVLLSILKTLILLSSVRSIEAGPIEDLSNGLIKLPALMFGDSKLDHVAAESNNVDFLFVEQWTDFKDYKEYCIANSIIKVRDISKAINLLN